MKLKTIFLASIITASSAFGQAKSDVVGYISLGNTGGGDAVPVNTEVTVSIPFVKKAEATLTVGSVAGNVITVSETITSGNFNTPASGAPYMLEVASGADEGIFLEVASNGTNTITLTGTGTDALSGITVGDSVFIRKAWTISTVFGTTLPDNTFISTFDSTDVNASAATQYTIFGGAWFNSTTGAPADHVILYPGESFLYRNNSTTPVTSLTIEGIVPTTKARIALKKDTAAAQETRFSYFSPVDETLANSGLSAIANDNDYISFFDNTATGVNKSASTQYTFFGGNWYNSTTGANADAEVLKGGEGYLYRRVDALATDSVSQDEQTYIGNL